MCDLAYVIQLERLERSTYAAQQVAATFLAAGAKGVDIPDLDDTLARFDRALIEEPKLMDPVEQALLRRLGLA